MLDEGCGGLCSWLRCGRASDHHLICVLWQEVRMPDRASGGGLG